MDNGGYDRNQMWYAFRITTQNNNNKKWKYNHERKLTSSNWSHWGVISKILFVITRNYSNQPN